LKSLKFTNPVSDIFYNGFHNWFYNTAGLGNGGFENILGGFHCWFHQVLGSFHCWCYELFGAFVNLQKELSEDNGGVRLMMRMMIVI